MAFSPPTTENRYSVRQQRSPTSSGPNKAFQNQRGHYREWIDACKGNGETLCNFDYSGSLIEHNLLGNVAHRAGKKLNWDAKNLKVTNDQAANKLISKSYRKGWEI